MSRGATAAEGTIQSAPKSRKGLAIVACAALAIVSYVLSAFAVLTKSPTADEPYHFAAAYTHMFLHDYRIDPEDPPLGWSWLAMAPIGRDELRGAMAAPEAMALWQQCPPDPTVQWPWLERVMNAPGDGGLDTPALVNRSRLAMALLAPAIVALACACAWRLAGPAAALAAGVLLAFDPLLLGHAPLIKNDAAITLVTLALSAALVATMRCATLLRLLALALCCAIAVTVKFSGLLLVALTIVALLVRALMSDRWTFLCRELQSRMGRLGAVASFGFVTMSICWLGIWAAYGFRFTVSATSPLELDEDWYVYQMQGRSFVARNHRSPTSAEARAAPVGHVVPVVLWLNHHRLLPDAYCMGFIFMHASSQSRNGYLLGEIRNTGWWYYFPLAILFKTPVASVVAVFGAAVAVVTMPALRWRKWKDAPLLREAMICLVVMGSGYVVVAMSSNLNLGVRHVMPLYPLMYIATAVVFALLRSAKPRAAAWVGGILAVGLAVETILAYPNYIAFFNAPSGGTRGGVRLLGDSNLDWGQDLPLLAQWQERHPTVKLYLSYFGAVDPATYGIRYTNIGGGANNPSNRPPGALSEPGVFAVSATQLQGIYLMPGAVKDYSILRKIPPRQVLGGTIYLYDYPFPTTRTITATPP